MARKASKRPATGPAGNGEDRLARASSLIERGQAALAAQSLLPALDVRAVEGDVECRLAAAALRLALAPNAQPPPAPRPEEALAAALDRLMSLVERQDQQIRTLQDLLEATL